MIAVAALLAGFPGIATLSHAESTTALDEQDIGPVLRHGRTVDEQTVRDMKTAGDIRIALFRQPGLEEHKVHVEVENGQVILSGQVADREARDLALDIAKRSSNGAPVEDRLQMVSR
jgi:osmotically-inducible protein OsmY